MKKNFLLITVLFYVLSIFAELGIFESAHLAIQSHDIRETNYSASVIKAQFASQKYSNHLSDFGGCEESTCHTGHCHHVSTFAIQSSKNYSNLKSKYVLNSDNNYSFLFARGIKRPPRNS
jgi:hypothetical protein